MISQSRLLFPEKMIGWIRAQNWFTRRARQHPSPPSRVALLLALLLFAVGRIVDKRKFFTEIAPENRETTESCIAAYHRRISEKLRMYCHKKGSIDFLWECAFTLSIRDGGLRFEPRASSPSDRREPKWSFLQTYFHILLLPKCCHFVKNSRLNHLVSLSLYLSAGQGC